MILAIKAADKDTTLLLLDEASEINRTEWESGRQLSNDLLKKIEGLVGNWRQLSGLIVFQGPGSFTSLRIGITVANTLADSLQVPIVGTSGEDWLGRGSQRLAAGENDRIVLPEYGAEANVTKPKK